MHSCLCSLFVLFRMSSFLPQPSPVFHDGVALATKLPLYFQSGALCVDLGMFLIRVLKKSLSSCIFHFKLSKACVLQIQIIIPDCGLGSRPTTGKRVQETWKGQETWELAQRLLDFRHSDMRAQTPSFLSSSKVGGVQDVKTCRSDYWYGHSPPGGLEPKLRCSGLKTANFRL